MASVVGRVVGLWRYPAKSLVGEQLPAVRLDHRGVELDRLSALVNDDGRIASGKTTRRFRAVRGLLLHWSRMDGDLPVITLADGRSAHSGSAEMDDLVRERAGEGWLSDRARISSTYAGPMATRPVEEFDVMVFSTAM